MQESELASRKRYSALEDECNRLKKTIGSLEDQLKKMRSDA